MHAAGVGSDPDQAGHRRHGEETDVDPRFGRISWKLERSIALGSLEQVTQPRFEVLRQGLRDVIATNLCTH